MSESQPDPETFGSGVSDYETDGGDLVLYAMDAGAAWLQSDVTMEVRE